VPVKGFRVITVKDEVYALLEQAAKKEHRSIANYLEIHLPEMLELA